MTLEEEEKVRWRRKKKLVERRLKEWSEKNRLAG